MTPDIVPNDAKSPTLNPLHPPRHVAASDDVPAGFDPHKTASEAARFLAELYPFDFPEDANLLLVSSDPGDDRKRAHWCKSVDHFVSTCERIGDKRRLYAPLGLQNKNIVQTRNTHGIGHEAEVRYVADIGFDIDFAAPGHTTEDNLLYPPDMDTITDLLQKMPLPPSAIVHTGGGIQARWFYDELIDVRETKDFERARAAHIGWFLTYDAISSVRGFKVDPSNKKLNKLLRVPGGMRHKSGAQHFIYATYTGRRYGISDIETHSIAEAVVAAKYIAGRHAPTAACTPLADDEASALPYRQLAELSLAQISRLKPDAVDEYDTWINYGLAIKRIGGDDDANFAVWDRWSQQSRKYDTQQVRDKWNSFAPQRASIASIFAAARDLSPTGELEGLTPPAHLAELSDAPSDAYLDAGPAEDGQTATTKADLRQAAADLLEQIPLGTRDPATGRIVISTTRTLPTADAFIKEKYTHGGTPTLVNYQEMLRKWTTAGAYEEIEDGILESELFPWQHEALRPTKNKDGEMVLVDFPANPANVNAAAASVKMRTLISSKLRTPCWIGSGQPPAELPDTRYVVVAPNGVFDLASPTPFKPVCQPTPRLFATHALPVPFIENAPEPREWLNFMRELWPEDEQSQIDTLQEWMGLCLTSFTGFQKMLGLFGPKRSGKGTILRVLKAMVGERCVAGPTLASLSTQFGLSSLLGKPLAIISDARLSSRTDTSIICERFLSITGEDTVDVDVKFKNIVQARLSARLVLVSNLLPDLKDASGALASRFIVLQLRKSFIDREDITLEDKLLSELQGITTWAAEGFFRLLQRGYFIQPSGSEDLRNELSDLTSPITQFLEEYADTQDASGQCPVAELFAAWCGWCREHGKTNVGDEASFGRDLRGKLPGLRVTQVRYDGGKRHRVYHGVRLTLTGAEVARQEQSRRNGGGVAHVA